MRRNSRNRQPEPSEICPHCECGLRFGACGERTVKVNEFRTIVHRVCPNCDNVVRAFVHDLTGQWLAYVRAVPDDALRHVDEYAELREEKYDI